MTKYIKKAFIIKFSKLNKVGFKMLGTTFNFFQCFSEKKSFSLGQIDLKDL